MPLTPAQKSKRHREKEQRRVDTLYSALHSAAETIGEAVADTRYKRPALTLHQRIDALSEELRALTRTMHEERDRHNQAMARIESTQKF